MKDGVEDTGLAGAIASARNGDSAAFAALVTAYQPSLVRYLAGTGVRDVEDVTQEVWIDIARNVGRFRGGEPEFRAWLFTVARHRRLDTWRVAGRRREDSVAVVDLGATADLVEAIAEERAGLARVIRLARTLPPDQAEVVLLRVVAGFTPADIAAITRRSPGAVRVLSHRGLRRLAEAACNASEASVGIR